MDRRFVGIEDLAQYLDISTNTIRSWIWQREIPYFKMGRLVRFDLKEIEGWLKDKKVEEIS